jgi:hypothetical protein
VGSSSGAAPPGVGIGGVQDDGYSEAEIAVVALNADTLAGTPRWNPALPAVCAGRVGVNVTNYCHYTYGSSAAAIYTIFNDPIYLAEHHFTKFE